MEIDEAVLSLREACYEYCDDLREVAGLRARLLVPKISEPRPYDNDKPPD